MFKYMNEYEWVCVEEGNIVYVGIMDFVQGELDELVYVEVEMVDEILDKDEVFGIVEVVKIMFEFFMLVFGKILEFNFQIDEVDGDNFILVNEDFYGEGWIVKIEMINFVEFEELMDVEAYKKLVS